MFASGGQVNECCTNLAVLTRWGAEWPADGGCGELGLATEAILVTKFRVPGAARHLLILPWLNKVTVRTKTRPSFTNVPSADKVEINFVV